MTTPEEWEAFHARAIVSRSLATDIVESWHRCRFSGVNPEAPSVSLNDVSLDSPFIRAAVPVMQSAAQLLTGADACLALADARGTVLWRWVSSESLGRELDRSAVMERVSFNEEVMGTNGIGTALESRRVATVLGASHYSRSFHQWACVAAPVFHPVTRRVCGAVNITCRAKDANAFLQVAIRSMTADVRAALHSAATVGQKRLLEAYLARRTKTLAPLVAVNDKIIISDELNLDHDSLWRRVKDQKLAISPVDLGKGLIARLWPVTPGTTEDGVVLEIETTPNAIAMTAPSSPETETDIELSPLERAERAVIFETLTRLGGNKSHAAEELRISRRSLYDKLHRYGLRF